MRLYTTCGFELSVEHIGNWPGRRVMFSAFCSEVSECFDLVAAVGAPRPHPVSSADCAEFEG